MGFTPTIMDYSPVNYVAQPADHIPPRTLIKHVGIYDRWAIAWLYRPIPGAFTLEAEQPTLQRWAAAQDTASYLRGSIAGDTDRLDDKMLIGANHITAAEYRLRNLARIVSLFDVSQDNVSELWVDRLKEAGYGSAGSTDSAQVVAILQFYVAHVVLGRDSVFTAIGLNSSHALSWWDLTVWRRRRTILTTSLLEIMRTLVAPAQTSHGVRAGVCQVLTTLRKDLASSTPMLNDPVMRLHTDSVRMQVDVIATGAACPP